MVVMAQQEGMAEVGGVAVLLLRAEVMVVAVVVALD